MEVIKTLLILLLAYFLGAVPMTYLSVKLLYGRDIRQIGYQNISIMNAAENVSFGLGILTALLDIVKAVLVMLLAKFWVGTNLVIFLAPILIILGDLWSPIVKFEGGKALAPIIGIMLIINWKGAFLLAFLFILTTFLFRKSQYATNLSLIALPGITWWQLGGIRGFLFGLALLIPIIIKQLTTLKTFLPKNNLHQRFM